MGLFGAIGSGLKAIGMRAKDQFQQGKLYGMMKSRKDDSDDRKRLGRVYGLDTDAASVPSYKKGGMVKKTGLAKVHKGEKVLTKKQQKRMGK